jgi:predicted phage terminase large subunit-like protein
VTLLDNPALAADELLRRRQARRSLVAYSQEILIPGRPVTEDDEEGCFRPVETTVAAHHCLLMNELQRTMQTPDGRLIVLMPPGSAKSTYGSVVGPTWYMGAYPGSQIILASYADDLARKMGRRSRQIVSSERYAQIFQTALSKSSSAAEQWALQNGSEYMAGGILSGLTGNRADGLVIDDPTKGRKEAESPANSETVWNAYQDDARTRLKPHAWRVIIMTRWDMLDMAGRILPDTWNGESGPVMCKDGYVWHVLCLPAICDRNDDPLGRPIGGPLWPEWFSGRHFEEFKQNPRSWLSLFQQKPTADEGLYFQRDRFQRYTKLPEQLTVYMSGDFAVKADDGDYTEIGVWGVCPVGNVYAMDWWSGQTTSDVWVEMLLDRAERFKPQWFIGEGGPIRRAVEPWLKKRMEERREYVSCEWLPSTADKPTMARSFQAMVNVGKVYLPHTDWAERVMDQLIRFPNGAHDDVADACGLLGRWINKMWEPIKPQAPVVVDFAAPMPITAFGGRQFGGVG